MKKAIIVIVCVLGAGLLGGQTGAGPGGADPGVSEAPSGTASGSRDYPNLHAPELSAADLAQLLDLHVVKGRLPDIDGLRIGSYQLFIHDDDGRERALGGEPIAYHYEAGLDRRRDGEMLVALGQGETKNELVLTLIARSGAGSTLTKYPIKGDGALVSYNFRGKSGMTTDDWTNIVRIGDNKVFTIGSGEASAKAKTAEVILRAYPEVTEQAAGIAP